MTLLELGEVIAFDLDNLVFDPELRYIETLNLLKICGPLIKLEKSDDSGEMVNPETKVVRFCHESVRAYLVSNRLREFRIHFEVTKISANAYLAKTCLVYISYVNSLELLPTRIYNVTIDYPLLQYALDEWPGHYRKVIGRDQQEELDNLAYNLLSSEKAFSIYQRWPVNPADVISPIYYSSLAGITGVVSMLLEEGVDPDGPPLGRWGTALGAACYAGRGDVVELLVDNGAEVETVSAEGLTPLQLASATIGARLVSMLIEKGTEDYLNRRSPNGWTALHWAARGGKEETVKLLVDEGADVLAADNEDQTPLDVALGQGRGEIVQLLVNGGADVNAFHRKYGTRLQHAARSGDERAVRILLKVGADPNLYREPKPFPRYEPGNPLQEAIGFEGRKPNGHEYIVRLLLAAGADPNLRSHSGNALHWAAGAANESIFQMLLDAGADVNAPVNALHEDVALDIAVLGGNLEIVRLLLAHGANPNIGGIALDRAIDRKFTAIEQILRSSGALRRVDLPDKELPLTYE